jgi:hypothetical protein
MTFQKPSSQLVANKWHPMAGDGTAKYPSAQAVLRASLGEVNYKFVSETVTSEHVRCACVMPVHLPFSHLLDVPWAMVYRAPDYRMIIVSVLDTVKWLDLARMTGSINWFKASNMTVTYQWEPPVRDSTGNKVRPPNALGVTSTISNNALFGSQKKEYDREEVLSDLRAGILTRTEIADKYELSRNRIHIIAKQYGITADTRRIPVIGA